MNTEEPKSAYDRHMEEVEQEDIAGALKANYAQDEHIEKRLEQISDVIRHYPQSAVEQRWPELKKERDAYLASTGELDTWVFLEQVGFKVLNGREGNAAMLKMEDGRELTISHGYHTDKSKIMVSFKTPGKPYEYLHLPVPKSIDDLYQFFSDQYLPVMQGAKHRAKYESNYVKALKNKKKS